MFDYTDNRPNPHTWRSRRPRARGLRDILSMDHYRWYMAQFAKFAVLEWINGATDIDQIVSSWLEQENDAT